MKKYDRLPYYSCSYDNIIIIYRSYFIYKHKSFIMQLTFNKSYD